MARERLDEAGMNAPALEAQLLAAHALKRNRAETLAHPEWEVPAVADTFLDERLKGKPLAYILGYREFYGRRFQVSPAVLIPRQETETLIDAWFYFEGSLPSDAAVLDLGTGSGCIGITLNLERPKLRVTLSDISEGALQMAQKNARDLGATVVFVSHDLFPAGEFDAIVTNPPYIEEGELLPREIAEHEPRTALFAGRDGLDFYRRLAFEGAAHIRSGGLLLTEVGDRQAAAVRQIFESLGWRFLKGFADLLGIERALAFSPRSAD